MLISLKVIVLVAYLGSWILVTLVIISKFLLDFCSFLLEAIGVNNSKGARTCYSFGGCSMCPFF